VTVGAQGTAGSDAARDWEAVRAASDIQYAPVQLPPPPKPPEWLLSLGQFLERVFGPIGRWLGISWPVFEKILLALLVLGLLVLAWALLAPLLRKVRQPRAEAAPQWTPERDDALALLSEADRLAAAGQFDEATHLLLRRSVGQIAAARPDWVPPATTAREIAGLLSLPAAARLTFKVIAERVERSRYALRALAAEDWQAARQAYADFALVEIRG
jgi:hypothetical protein